DTEHRARGGPRGGSPVLEGNPAQEPRIVERREEAKVERLESVPLFGQQWESAPREHPVRLRARVPGRPGGRAGTKPGRQETTQQVEARPIPAHRSSLPAW